MRVDFASESELKAHYSAVHRRLWTAPQKPKIPVEISKPPTVVFISEDEATAFDLVPCQTPDHAFRWKRQSLKNILREVAAAHNRTIADIISASHSRPLVNARFEFCYRACMETKASLPEIGRFIGGRDHSTVIHAVATYCDRNGLGYPRGADWVAPARRIERVRRANERRRAYRAALKEMRAGAELQEARR